MCVWISSVIIWEKENKEQIMKKQIKQTKKQQINQYVFIKTVWSKFSLNGEENHYKWTMDFRSKEHKHIQKCQMHRNDKICNMN